MKLDTLFPHSYLIDLKLNVLKYNQFFLFCFFNLDSTNYKFGKLLKSEEKYLGPIEF